MVSSVHAGHDRKEMGPRLRARARYFRVLGDPTRLRLLEALLEGPHTVSELTAIAAAPQSRISNHLACLKWCGLVISERRGREVVYRITDPRVGQVLELSGALSAEHSEHLASCKRIGPDWV